MIQLALLIAWMSAGSVIAVARTEAGQPRLQWLPLALILGPLWLAVSAEQQPRSLSSPAPALVRRS